MVCLFFWPGEDCNFIIQKLQCWHEHFPACLSLLQPATAVPSPPHPTYSAEYTPLIVSTSIVFCMCCQLQIYFQRIVFTNCMLYIMPFCLFLKQCKDIEYPLLWYSWNWEKIHLRTYMRTMAMHVCYLWVSDFMPIGLSRLYNYHNGARKSPGALVEINA